MANRAYLSALTGLRFVAAYYVVLYHAYPAPQLRAGELDPAWFSPVKTWSVFCSHGYVAVSFFFTLSGFILAYNYPAGRPFDTDRFYRARFLRIYPVYLLGVLVALPFLVVHTVRDQRWDHAAIECALALSLTQAWVPPFWSAVNVPGWSLSVEAFFYALFPRLLAPVAWLTATPRRALAALVLLQGCALLAPALGTWRFGITHTDTSWLANFFRYLPPFALPEFAFGVVLGQLRVQGTLRAKPIARLYRPALLLLAFVLCSERVPYLFLHNGALLPLFAAVIVHNSFGADGAGWLARPWAIVLGNASYALYILHLPAWIYLKIAIERTGYDPLASWVFPVYSLLAIAISLAASAWIERRGRSWKTRSTSERVREEA